MEKKILQPLLLGIEAATFRVRGTTTELPPPPLYEQSIRFLKLLIRIIFSPSGVISEAGWELTVKELRNTVKMRFEIDVKGSKAQYKQAYSALFPR